MKHIEFNLVLKGLVLGGVPREAVKMGVLLAGTLVPASVSMGRAIAEVADTELHVELHNIIKSNRMIRLGMIGETETERESETERERARERESETERPRQNHRSSISISTCTTLYLSFTLSSSSRSCPLYLLRGMQRCPKLCPKTAFRPV
jgi:hypothetical protein